MSRIMTELEKGFREYMKNNHGEDWEDRFDEETIDNIRCEFEAGVEWQKNQPLSGEQADQKLGEYINNTTLVAKLKLGQYALSAISGLAINANSDKTTISTEFNHNGKMYEAKMLITQTEL